MKYAIFFVLLAATTGYLGATSQGILIGIFWGYLFISFAIIATLYFLRPKLSFFKKATGRITIFSWLLFSPYFLLARLSLALHSFTSNESSIDKVQENIYLGRFHWSFEAEVLDRINAVAVLDLTWEFSASQEIIRNRTYLNVAVLDGTSLTTNQLVEVISWLTEQLKKGSVFIHCALGHSRSAMTIAAYLVEKNWNLSPEEVIKIIVSQRGSVKLNDEQYASLLKFAER